MNAAERAEFIDTLESMIQGGVAESLENLVEKMGFDLDKLDRHTLAVIDEMFFCCDQCNWTMPVDELCETEAGDGFLCRECALDCAEGYPDL